MLQEIIIAFRSYSLAHSFIIKNKLWKWILLSGLFYTALLGTGLYFFWEYSNELINYIYKETGIMEWLDKSQNDILYLLVIVGQIIIMGMLLFFFFSWFKYLFLIIGAPVFALLSEKTEEILTGHEYPFSLKQLLKDIVRGIRIAFRNLLWQTVYLLAILILSFIPVIGWIAPLIAILVEAYYFGFSMLDYNSERKNMPATQSIDFISRHKGLAIGNGLAFYLLHLLPVVGWLLAPSYAVVAATISLHEAENKSVFNI